MSDDGVRSVTEDTFLSLEEFCSWGRRKPLIPGVPAESDMRLGWSKAFEKAFRDAAFKDMVEAGQGNVEGLNVRDVKQPVKTWLQLMFSVLISSPKVRNLQMHLGQLPSEARSSLWTPRAG